jgi:hypothetical protein
MDFEQIVKRLEWLDEERRRDKEAQAALEQQVKGLEGELKATNLKFQESHIRLDKLSPLLARIDEINDALLRYQTEIKNYVDRVDEKGKANQQEAEKRQQTQLDALSKVISEQKKLRAPFTELRREFKAHLEDEGRRNQQLAEWEGRMEGMLKVTEEMQRGFTVNEEVRHQESKRLTDLQGELAAARRRLDETREKNDLFTDGLRRVEARMNELLTSEADRRQAQTAFFENQARLQVERDRAWKDWEENLGASQKQTEAIERRLQEWDIAQRALKRAEESYEEIVQKFERRINEISEMQRLGEDRSRQEWVTFKTDEQKRWTSFTLSQDEARQDLRSVLTKLEERLTSLEDLGQTQQDILQQTKEANEQLFQGILSQIHELLTAYERIMSTK